MPSFKKVIPLEAIILGFYLTIWLINPSNKLIILIAFIFLIFLKIKLKHWELGSLCMFLLSSVLPMGKQYLIILNDLKEFPLLKELYPIGLTQTITIFVTDVFFATFAVSIFINLIKNHFNQLKGVNINLLDIVLIVFFAYGIFADLYSSKHPFLSILLKKGLFEYIFVYFFLKFYLLRFKNLTYLLFIVFASILFFESFLALQQFISSSPLGKNFEPYFSIEQFGGPADELTFFFRPIGTFTHANYLGIFAAVLLPLLFYVLIFRNKSSAVIFLSVFMGIIILPLTLSRTALIAFLIAIGYFLFILEHRLNINLIKLISSQLLVVFLLILLPLGLYIMPRIAKSFYSFEPSGGLTLRIRQISESIELLTWRPLTGVGTGMSVLELIELNKSGVFAGFPSPAHNYFILLAIENGLPSLILLLTIIVISLKKLLNISKPFAFASISSLIVIIIGGFFQPSFEYGLLLILLSLNFAKISFNDQAN